MPVGAGGVVIARCNRAAGIERVCSMSNIDCHDVGGWRRPVRGGSAHPL